MRPIQVDVVGAGNSAVIPLDRYIAPFQVSCFITIVSGAIAATLQYTNDDIYAPGYNPATGNWTDHADLTAVVANSVGTIISPVSAVRLVNAAAGTALLSLSQGGLS